MKPLKIGVIGVGHMGRNHARNLSEEKRFDLIGVFDENEDQAKEVASKYDVTAFGSMNDLLDNVEAVVIAVPSSLHKTVAFAVAEHGGGAGTH